MGAKLMTVHVTAEHIATQQCADCYECMVAKALYDATGLTWNVWKDSAELEEWGQSGRIRFGRFVRDMIYFEDTPEEAREVEPFSFLKGEGFTVKLSPFNGYQEKRMH